MSQRFPENSRGVPRVTLEEGHDAENPLHVQPAAAPLPEPLILDEASAQISTSGDNTILTPAAGKYLAIYSLILQSESAVETLALVKSGSDTVLRFLATSKGAGIAVDYPERSPLIVNDGDSLKINLGGANAFGYTIRYSVEDI